MMAAIMCHCCECVDKKKRGVVVVSKSKLFDTFPGVVLDELGMENVHVVQDLAGLVALLSP